MENTKLTLLDKVAASPVNNDESWTDKALREVHLIGQGTTGIVDAAKQSVSSGHRLETAGEVALSVGAGLGMAYLTRGRSIGFLASKTLAAEGAMSLIKDGVEHGSQALGAMRDAWHSDKNMQQDSEIMKQSVGTFAFDTALTSVGGLAGGKVGHGLFKPDIPSLFFDQMSSKTGIRQDYYNKFYAPEWKANMAVDARGTLPPEKIADAKVKLPGYLRGVRTYSEYWDNEIAEFGKANPDHAKLDSTGIKNFLVNDRPRAVKLDRVGAEIRSFGDKDLNDPQVMNGLFDKFQEGRRLIYGNDPQQARRMMMGPPLTDEEMIAMVAKDRGTFSKMLDRMGLSRGSEASD